MRKRLVSRFLIIPLVGLLLLCTCPVIWKAPPKPAIHAVDLLLDVTVLPPGWFVEGGPIAAHDNLHLLTDQDARDYACVGFAPPGAEFPYEVTASQTIWNFGGSFYAAIKFYTEFRPEVPAMPAILQGWSYRSKVANRFRLYCWHRRGYSGCTAIGQYGDLISAFSTPIGAEYDMTLGDLERILKAIDERMAKRLSKPLPTVPAEMVTPVVN